MNGQNEAMTTIIVTANPTIREQSFDLDSCLSKKKLIKEKSPSQWIEPYEIANSLPFLTYKNVDFISSPIKLSLKVILSRITREFKEKAT